MSSALSKASRAKRVAFDGFIDRHVLPYPEIKAIVIYGSVASGTAVDASDLDALVFMDPLDQYLLPAEAIWGPSDDSFRSIFSSEQREGDLQLDFTRVAWREWEAETFQCPGALRACLGHTLVAFERPGYDVQAILRRLSRMTPEQQQEQLDAALLALDDLGEDPEAAWGRSHAEALDSLNAAWDAVLRGVYAANKAWFPFRGRAVRNLSSLPWTAGLSGDLLLTCVSGRTDHAGYVRRYIAISQAKQRLLKRLEHDARYGEDPVYAAFLRKHDEPGRAWNMVEWNKRRRQN